MEEDVKEVLSESEMIEEVRNGKTLNELKGKGEITSLVKLAAICNHKNGCEEINSLDEITDDANWNRVCVRVAVGSDFQNIKKVPVELCAYGAPELAIRGTQPFSNRKELRSYMDILNNYIDEDTKSKIVSFVPKDRRYFTNGHTIKKDKLISKRKTKNRREAQSEKISPAAQDRVTISELGENDTDALSFLNAPVEEKTQEWFESLVNSNLRLPDNFLERLLLPNKNAAFYKRTGDTEKAEYWESQKLSYLSKDIALRVGELHPEAVITVPMFFPSAEYIQEFWNRRIEAGDTKGSMTHYFLSFPENRLNSLMTKDIVLSFDVFAHAPSVLRRTEVAIKYFSKHPRELLMAPEEYQLEGLLLSGSVTLSKENVEKIKNEELRNKIKLALGYV